MRARNFVAAFFIIAYGIGMALMGYMGRHTNQHVELMVVLTLVAGLIAAGGFWALWNLNVSRREDNLESGEKRKRESLDSVLRNLSDADLQALKRRLSETSSPDGELIDEEQAVYREVRKS